MGEQGLKTPRKLRQSEVGRKWNFSDKEEYMSSGYMSVLWSELDTREW
jgi:hypothetical protein